jgi:hypothetical protein
MLTKQKRQWAKKAENSPKDMWKVVNEASGAKSSRSTAAEAIIGQFVSPKHAVEETNKLFAEMQVQRPRQTAPQDSPEWAPLICIESVYKELSILKPCKAAGIDNIPTLIYKIAAPIIAPPSDSYHKRINSVSTVSTMLEKKRYNPCSKISTTFKR